MGRLFWKFFLLVMVAQAATVVGISTAIWLRHRNAPVPVTVAPAEAEQVLDRAVQTLEREGVDALRDTLERQLREGGPTLFVVDANGLDLLGRPLPRRAAGADAGEPGADRARATRRVELADGRTYTLVVAGPGPGRPGPPRPRGPGGGPAGGPPGPGHEGGLRFPLEPLVGGVVVSFGIAALLAWYVAKPVRRLRDAFGAAARGDLGIRIGDAMGGRRDELADLGREFDRTAAQLETLMESQRRLLHDVSHEMRSPLARLQAAVGLARQQPENVDAAMDRIEREAVRIDRLVDELLTLSRVEAGMGTDGHDDVDPVELVGEVVEDAAFENGADAGTVRFDTDVGALAGVRIRGNRELLHRALENVVRNAARHTPPGGPVRIEGRHDAARREIRITVSDAGPGVGEDELASIFTPFYRGTQAKGTRGHGLGLAIARRVVAAHGGRIVASNRPGGGLAVDIDLPV